VRYVFTWKAVDTFYSSELREVNVANENGSGNSKTGAVLGVAILVLVAYAIAIAFLFVQSKSAPSETWTRYTYLLGGIEAIAFSAVGYLFGKEVHRQQAANAEKRAADAQQQATAASSDAAAAQSKGQSLAKMIKVKAGAQTKATVVGAVGGPGGNESQWEEAATFADSLFPE
jgi:hypothetical protein